MGPNANAPIQILSREDVFNRLASRGFSHAETYLAMYSSWYGGIVKDPSLMFVPIDDHVVHRGDGVFEAIKLVDGHVYTLKQHLDRLERSAQMAELPLPISRDKLSEIILGTVLAAETKDGIIRLYISRGPGGFTTNPYESVGSQVYVVVTAARPLSAEKYKEGVRVRVSRIRVKEGRFANVKSCNYLPNVLMKKEAVDLGVDFTVSLDERGFIAEGSTENFFILNSENEIIVPPFDRTLKGVTLSRLMELSDRLVKSGVIKGVRQDFFDREDVHRAKEAFLCSTTMDVIAAVEFENRKIGVGRPGPLAQRLLELLRQDQEDERRTGAVSSARIISSKI